MPRAVVYLRLPHPRNGRKNPPVVQWSTAKERELWAMLRSSTDVDWRSLASHFGVSVVYVLQQAAWLYEKELKLLRKKMSQINVVTDVDETSAQRPSPTTMHDSGRSRDIASLSSSSSHTRSRPLLSTSRHIDSEESLSSLSMRSSFEGFLPQQWDDSNHRSRQTADVDLSTSSVTDNSVTQSALEEALLDQQ